MLFAKSTYPRPGVKELSIQRNRYVRLPERGRGGSMKRGPIHLSAKDYPEIEAKLTAHFRALFAAHAHGIIEQTVKLYEAEIAQQWPPPNVKPTA